MASARRSTMVGLAAATALLVGAGAPALAHGGDDDGDDRMERETTRLQRIEGVNACIEGGAVLAAARALRAAGQLGEGETVVLFNTGNLQNY